MQLKFNESSMKNRRTLRAIACFTGTIFRFRENSRGLDRQTVKLATFKKQHPRSEGILVEQKIFCHRTVLTVMRGSTPARAPRRIGLVPPVAIGLAYYRYHSTSPTKTGQAGYLYSKSRCRLS